MADVTKNLGQKKPAAATLIALDTVPAGKSHVFSSIMVCNQGPNDDHFRLSHAIAGAADDPIQYFYLDEYLAANESFPVTIGITAAATDVIRCYSTLGQCSFNAWGVES